MLDQTVIDKLEEDYKSLDNALISAIASEYDSETDAREVLNSLHLEAIANDVDWSTFENSTKEAIAALQLEESSPDTTDKQLEDVDDELTDDLRFLRQSFPNIPLASIKHKYRVNNGDLDKVTDLLLNQSLIDEELTEQDRYLQAFPGKSRRSQTSSSNKELKRAEETKPSNIKTLRSLLGVSEENATKLLDENDGSLMKSFIIANSNATPAPAVKQIAPSQTYNQVASRLNKNSINYENSGYRAGDVKILREEAESAYERRQESMEKAREMYQKSKSNPLYRSAAGYYAGVASQHGQNGHQAMDSMFRTMIESKSSSYVIDFHGVPMHVALEVATEKLRDWWAHESKAQSISSLRLITGAGRHSSAGIPKIKNAIRKLLREQDWRYEEGISYFDVIGCK
ncbi:SMR domain protein [Sugiyamaella lignohabitans]|uniref:SMR domain protein n=1 Tax=Sugiyamaella lignohabitans TaxID=796027 RepID=A0A161HLC6_9ASCO|nr:SMR domain protein [Sugiyamaella lignohabitans]ANB12838.1 SMR domain protein [Sugiyamaella lignohabitans]